MHVPKYWRLEELSRVSLPQSLNAGYTLNSHLLYSLATIPGKLKGKKGGDGLHTQAPAHGRVLIR